MATKKKRVVRRAARVIEKVVHALRDKLKPQRVSGPKKPAETAVAKKPDKTVAVNRGQTSAVTVKPKSALAKKPVSVAVKPKSALAKKPVSVAAKPTSVLAKKPVSVTTKPKSSVTKTLAKGDSAIVAGGVADGGKAPKFELADHEGKSVSSSALEGQPYVLYFYPKDDTPGCTIEACGFRDTLTRFTARGLRVIGVSPDSVESHARFRQKHGLNFTLLSDPERRLANAYGVWVKKQNYGREYMGIERSTFLVDEKGVVRRVWRSVRVPGHVDQVLEEVKHLR